MEAAQRAASACRWLFSRTVGNVRIHAVSGAARGMAAGRRLASGADTGICAEGGTRGQAGNELAQSPRSLRGRRKGLHRKDSRSFARGRIPQLAANAGAAAVVAGRTEFA